MRRTAKLVAVAATAAAMAGWSAAAGAAETLADQKVDGTIIVGDSTCTWSDADTSANPPDSLTIDRDSVNPPGGNLTCSGDITATLNNDPAMDFDDAAGTATADLVDITAQQSFVSCRYQATDVMWDRQGTARDYANRSFTAGLVSGGFLCPSSQTINTGDATLSFH
ncbi:hypothetical protein [Salininema proteolyticum]|uniref:Secreted protein n=1 Tax=Salininema proteolyticum TaxID=1607685 RepID=A0ABV8TX25_9ACTN